MAGSGQNSERGLRDSQGIDTLIFPMANRPRNTMQCRPLDLIEVIQP
jgi:hypothetical protein